MVPSQRADRNLQGTTSPASVLLCACVGHFDILDFLAAIGLAAHFDDPRCRWQLGELQLKSFLCMQAYSKVERNRVRTAQPPSGARSIAFLRVCLTTTSSCRLGNHSKSARQICTVRRRLAGVGVCSGVFSSVRRFFPLSCVCRVDAIQAQQLHPPDHPEAFLT